MTDTPDWEGFCRDVMAEWPVTDIDGVTLWELSVKHRLIREIHGGFDPDVHQDWDRIDPEPGDPWYEYNFERTKE